MKLYTEESLKTIYLQGWYDGSIGMNNTDRQEDAITYVTPIELPSDEEIEEQANSLQNEEYTTLYNEGINEGFYLGIEFMKKLILNQNK